MENRSAVFAEVNVIKISDFGTATTPVTRRLSVKNGYICWKEAGLSLAVVYERHGKNGNISQSAGRRHLKNDREQQQLPGLMTAQSSCCGK